MGEDSRDGKDSFVRLRESLWIEIITDLNFPFFKRSGSVRACGLKLCDGDDLTGYRLVRLRESLWIEICFILCPCLVIIVRLRESLWIEIDRTASLKLSILPSGSVRACRLKFPAAPPGRSAFICRLQKSL